MGIHKQDPESYTMEELTNKESDYRLCECLKEHRDVLLNLTVLQLRKQWIREQDDSPKIRKPDTVGDVQMGGKVARGVYEKISQVWEGKEYLENQKKTSSCRAL